MSSSRAPAIPLSLTCCWGWKLPEDRTIPVASQQETCEQMMEEVVMQCGPRASGVRTERQPSPFAPALGSPACPHAVGLSAPALQICWHVRL